MRMLIFILLMGSCGCSTAPIAGVMDCLFPSKVGAGSQDRLPYNPDAPNLNDLPPDIYPRTSPLRTNTPRVELNEPIPAPSFPPPEL